MTQSKFATVLSVSLRTVANWASCPAMVPRAAAQDMLDQVLADASAATRAKCELVRLTC
jgi:DNA-binding transcriptional regulator YiaG